MIPTLEELLTRLENDIPGREQLKLLCRNVASGNRHPTNPPLPENVIILACQAMTVLFQHIDRTRTKD